MSSSAWACPSCKYVLRPNSMAPCFKCYPPTYVNWKSNDPIKILKDKIKRCLNV
jgi:hypothetical protein